MARALAGPDPVHELSERDLNRLSAVGELPRQSGERHGGVDREGNEIS
ncbi:hypothetical protein ACFOON_07970 [Novosphingobium piscinae]|nr:hypothetical protein [Novosphingobium piscinae]